MSIPEELEREMGYFLPTTLSRQEIEKVKREAFTKLVSHYLHLPGINCPTMRTFRVDVEHALKIQFATFCIKRDKPQRLEAFKSASQKSDVEECTWIWRESAVEARLVVDVLFYFFDRNTNRQENDVWPPDNNEIEGHCTQKWVEHKALVSRKRKRGTSNVTSSTTTEEDEEETEEQEEEEHESDVVESEAVISKGGDSRLLKRLSETLVLMQSVNALVRPDFPLAEVLQPPCDVSDIADLLSPELSTSIVDIINSSSQVEDEECDDEESDDEDSDDEESDDEDSDDESSVTQELTCYLSFDGGTFVENVDFLRCTCRGTWIEFMSHKCDYVVSFQ